jgi:hypothetical protein
MNEKEGKSFDVAKSIMAQLPFFSCKNIVLDNEAQKDIAKYIYCSDFGISPYKGSYGEQPKKWIDKSFLIKKMINSQESK